MADAKKKKDPEFRSPRGVWRFPKLDAVDYGTKEFPKPKGEFSVQHILDADADEVKAFIAKLQPLYEEAISKGKEEFKKLKVDARKKLEAKNGKDGLELHPLFTTLFDEETEEPTGQIMFKFAMAASGEFKQPNGKVKKWTAKPKIFDAKGKPMSPVPQIWGGSEGIVAFSARPYFIPSNGLTGLKLKLMAAQVIKLVQGGGRDAEGYGFESHDDGYEYSEDDVRKDDEEEKKPGNDEEEGDDTDASTEAGEEEDF
jgi:hypothetical protein